MAGQDYRQFLERKSQLGGEHGFEPLWMPDNLFDFQAHLADWTIRQGRAGLFAACGLGKTPMYFTFAENVVRHTNRPFLVATTLGDSAQAIDEAAKFGVEAVRSRDGRFPSGPRVVVTNYEKLHLFDPDDFGGAAGNESSILKNFDGRRRGVVTEFFRTLRYRLLCTATAAPNDYVELGTHSEALGYLGHQDMLSKFFKNSRNTNQKQRLHGKDAKWTFRGHSETPFWRWVCSWARAIRKPSDLGFDDAGFVLPPFGVEEHVVDCEIRPDGELYAREAVSLDEIRAERRRTLNERCEKAAEILCSCDEPGVAWCNLNPEGDLLEKLIPGAVQVSGSDSDEAKEEAFDAFAKGQIRVIVTKPRIACHGMNWQHCNRFTYFPTFSFEEWEQLLHRFHRYGQKRPVTAHVVAGKGEYGVMSALQRKAEQFDRMFARLVELMNDPLHLLNVNPFVKEASVPSWL